jgi:hypothetical protein
MSLRVHANATKEGFRRMQEDAFMMQGDRLYLGTVE